MTPTEIKDALKLLNGRVGPGCYVDVTITGASYDKTVIAGTILQHGGKSSRVVADDWQEVIRLMTEAVVNGRDAFQAALIKNMALAIIRLTDEHGECTDSMLRSEFDAGDVTAFLDRALERADAMAGNGPFSVRRVAGSNAA
jgi:hypothetical protein